MEIKSPNPLLKHFRQPVIYLKLPSQGQFYPEGSLNMPESGELPVYPLTSRDEVTLKTPDALINGLSVVEVIQSCIPDIKDAWQLPSVDLDAVFIAIRIASYGNKLPVNVTCPSCKQTNEYEIDLQNTLSRIKQPDFSSLLATDSLKIKFKPQPYISVNKINSNRFEEQRMVTQFSDVSVPEEQRLAALKEQMRKLAELNIDVLADSTEYIQTMDNQVVSDKKFIFEFYQNADSKLIKLLDAKFAELNSQSGSGEETIVCGDCKFQFTTSVEFDYANFFVTGS